VCIPVTVAKATNSTSTLYEKVTATINEKVVATLIRNGIFFLSKNSLHSTKILPSTIQCCIIAVKEFQKKTTIFVEDKGGGGNEG